MSNRTATEIKLLKLVVAVRDQALAFEHVAEGMHNHADAMDIIVERGNQETMQSMIDYMLKECPELSSTISLIEPLPKDGSMKFTCPDEAEPMYNPRVRDTGIN
jgi:hypothetical protein